MKKILCFIFLFVSIFTFAQKDNSELDKAQNQINKYGDLYFKFPISKKSDLQNLPNYISIDNVVGKTVFAYVHKNNFDKLLNLQLPFEVVAKSGGTKALTMATTVSAMANWDKYPTYSVYVQMMQDFATNFPSICRLDTIGFSQDGRLIIALKITDNPDANEDEPEYFYTGQMHGDEVVGYIMLLRLADYLLNNYGSDVEVTNMINTIEIWINPLANPDGAYNGGDNDISGAQRYLSNGVDPNRNYKNPNGDHPDGSSWAQETIDMMNFADAHHFVMSANLHSGAEVANYPWDTWTSAQRTHSDDNWFQYVSHEYADTVFTNSSGGYFTGVSSNGIIEGGDWYIVEGSRQDYMTYYKHCREITYELSNQKLLDVAELPNHWNYNYRSMLNYIKESLYGIRGIITDSCTGLPIEAKVEVISHDDDNSFVYSSLPVGDYHRPIYAGTYNVTYSAPGYQSVTINNIVVNNQTATVQNVSLQPISPTANFIAINTSSCTGEIEFIDSSVTSAGTSYLWDFGDNSTDSTQNPVHFYTSNGTYSVTLSIDNGCGGTDSYTQTNYIDINMPNVPNTADGERCGSGQVILYASASGNIEWYDAPTGGNLVGTGTPFTTPILNSTTTYYVENFVQSAPQNVGNTNSVSGGSYFIASNEHFLIFDCYTPLILNSVEVNAATSENRNIILRESSGTILYDTIINIPAGTNRIDLNFNLPVANNLELVGPGSPNLFRSNSSVSYPYSIPGALSINNSDAGSGYYYYFYDWEVQEPGCESARTQVNAIINTVPTADFSYSASNLNVDFTNSSIDGTTFLWDFGDGNTDTLANPSYQYSTPDTYSVTLIAMNGSCSDTITQVIDVAVSVDNAANNNNSINIYPNPTFNNKFFITFNGNYVDVKIEIYNLTGKKILTKELFEVKNDYVCEIQLDNFVNKGIYFIEICSKKYDYIKYLIIN